LVLITQSITHFRLNPKSSWDCFPENASEKLDPKKSRIMRGIFLFPGIPID
jgi:hypothetical protein